MVKNTKEDLVSVESEKFMLIRQPLVTLLVFYALLCGKSLLLMHLKVFGSTAALSQVGARGLSWHVRTKALFFVHKELAEWLVHWAPVLASWIRRASRSSSMMRILHYIANIVTHYFKRKCVFVKAVGDHWSKVVGFDNACFFNRFLCNDIIFVCLYIKFGISCVGLHCKWRLLKRLAVNMLVLITINRPNQVLFKRFECHHSVLIIHCHKIIF